MDMLNKLNELVEYIEENLCESIDYNILSSYVFCSVHEFSRIFIFISGISISDYIRYRRLSQAALDIRNGNEKIIDVATKYCYESQSSFSRAFKDFHGCTPKSARNNGTNLKHHPKISFSLMIKGVNKMDFRLIDKDSFVICGLKGLSTSIPEKGDHIDPLWREFMNEYNERLYNGDDSYYHEPLWQVGAYSFESRNNGTQCIIGSELGDKPVLDGMDIEEIPESTWAVFKIVGLRDKQFANGFDETYTRIHTEWFPSSGYKRDESMCHLEVFGPGDANSVDYEWEIWIPVVNDDKS